MKPYLSFGRPNVNYDVLVPGYDRSRFQVQLCHCFAESFHFTFTRPGVSQRFTDLKQARRASVPRNNEINFFSRLCLVVENLRVKTSKSDERKILQKMSGIDR